MSRGDWIVNQRPPAPGVREGRHVRTPASVMCLEHYARKGWSCQTSEASGVLSASFLSPTAGMRAP
jgi:hypothetical protein